MNNCDGPKLVGVGVESGVWNYDENAWSEKHASGMLKPALLQHWLEKVWTLMGF